MKSYNPLRHSYVEMVRANRSEIMSELQRIEHQKLALREKHISILKSSRNGPLMKTYLWFNFLIEAYRFEIREEERLSNLRNKRELELHQMKTALNPVER